MSHHKHLATELDPDKHKHTCTGKDSSVTFFFFLTGLLNMWKTAYNVYIGEETKSKDKPKYTVSDLMLLLGWQIAVFIFLFLLKGWWAYIVLWIFPIYVAMLLDSIRSFSEHSHPEPDSKADEHRLITFIPNIIEAQIFAPLNMNHHVAHHLYPSIPYYNLPEATELLMKSEKSEELVWRKSYIRYLYSWYKQLPLTNCNEKSVA